MAKCDSSVYYMIQLLWYLCSVLSHMPPADSYESRADVKDVRRYCRYCCAIAVTRTTEVAV